MTWFFKIFYCKTFSSLKQHGTWQSFQAKEPFWYIWILKKQLSTSMGKIVRRVGLVFWLLAWFSCFCSPNYPHLLYSFQQNKCITLLFWEYIYSWDFVQNMWKRCDFTQILSLSFKAALTNCVFNPFSRHVWYKMKE